MGLTAELAGFVADLTPDRLPPDVIERARCLVLDHVGNVIQARHAGGGTPALLAAARALGLATGKSGVFGDAARYTPAGAALLNASLARSLDLDDVHEQARLHPGAAVIPAALAAGEMAGAHGSDVLAAIVAGYEVMCRLSHALPTAEHRARGFHPTATCGAFAAAAAAARVFGLSATGVAQAFGAALGTAAGTLHFLTDGPWTGCFQVGWASMGGLAAATLAREGFGASTQALEGEHGFLAAFAPAADPARATEGLGRDFELMRVRLKAGPGGAAELAASAGAVREKFARLTEPVLGAGRAARLADAVLAIDRLEDVAGLARL